MAECQAPPVRVLVADDHPMMREGLRAIIAGNGGIELVAEAGNGREAVELYKLHRPDVVLMDLQMPEMSGTEAMIGILKFHPEARIVAFTTYSGDALVARALRLGAVSYLLKNTARTELISCVLHVHAGGRPIAREAALQLAAHHAGDALSGREIEVLRLISQGNSNRRAAMLLGVTEDTVKGHVKNILSKLSANDRTHAVMIAINRGILDV